VNVKLIVYDVSGSELSILTDKKQNSGTYEIVYSGEKLSSGIYFYTLLVNNVLIETKKMILIK
jgi:hypothetical protein